MRRPEWNRTTRLPIWQNQEPDLQGHLAYTEDDCHVQTGCEFIVGSAVRTRDVVSTQFSIHNTMC
jgi:hypothetical protein